MKECRQSRERERERGECMERRGAVVVDDDFSPREGVPLGSGKWRPVTTAGGVKIAEVLVKIEEGVAGLGKRDVGRV